MVPEQHLDYVVDFLRNRLQPYMDVWNSMPDGILVGTVLWENVIPGGMWPIPTLSPDTPAFEVAIPQQIMQNFDVAQSGAEEALTIALRVWMQEYGDVATSVERVYRKSLRMQAALLAGLTDPNEDAFGDHASVTDVRSSWRADPTADQRESYTSSLVMVLQVEGSGQIR
jgi:hypothetical protein